MCLGSSHLYSHSQGLSHQPGFMSAAKFLLPWEVPLAKVTPQVGSHLTTAPNIPPQDLEVRWPAILEHHLKRAALRPPEEPKDDKITVKVFIGYEYECGRGHRCHFGLSVFVCSHHCSFPCAISPV